MPSDELVGSQTPRIWTPRNNQYPTHGPLIAAIARIAGIDLDPWQQLVLDIAGEYHPDTGRWIHREVVYIVARQNGKTMILRARLLAGLFALADRQIYHTAQNRALPKKMYRALKKAIVETPTLKSRLVRATDTNGFEAIETTLPALYEILAPHPGAFRGDSVGLVAFDEIREQRHTDLWGAAFPTQMAHPNPQIWAMSNAGDIDSVQLNLLRDRGRAAADHPASDPRLAYFEWSADPTLSIDDPAAWAQANPSLGTRITLDTIRDARNSLEEADFRTEVLCQWLSTRREPAIPWDRWEACGGTPPEVDVSMLPRPVAGIHIDGDRTHAALAVAAERDGRLIVDVVEEWENDDGIDLGVVTTDTLAWLKQLRIRTLAYDRAAASTVAHTVEQRRISIEKIDRAEYVVASQNLFDAVVTGHLWHRNNPSLDAQIAAAGRKDSAEGPWYISRAESGRTIPAVLAVAFAVSMAYRPRPTVSIH